MSKGWLASLRQHLPSLKPDYDPFPSYRSRIAIDCVHRGDALFHDGQFDEAIGVYGEAIEWQPELAEAFCNRSSAFLEKAEHDRALKDCNRAIELKPGLAQAFCNRGTVYVETGNIGRAVQEYQQAICLEPGFALALSNRGFALLLDGNFDLATIDCDKAIALSPDLGLAFSNRGAVAFCQERFADATDDFAKALSLDPNDAANVVWLYLAEARDGEPNPAQLRQRAANIDLAKWPGAAVEFLRESLTAEGLLSASRDRIAHRENKQRCAALFVIGQRGLLEGDLELANGSFKAAIESGAVSSPEFIASRVELQHRDAYP